MQPEPSTEHKLKPYSEGQMRYSKSSFASWEICPAKLYFKDLARQGLIETDTALSAVFGSGVHKGIEMRLKEEKNPFAVAEDFIAAELEKEKFSDFVSDDYKELSGNLNKCLTNFERDIYPNLLKTMVDPNAQVEIKFQTPYRKGILVGTVDYLEPGTLVDWKSGKVPDKNGVINVLDAYVYHRLVAPTLGEIRQFTYAHLQGKNVAYRPSKKKGGKPVLDDENPKYVYKWNLHLNNEMVEDKFHNTIDPIAKEIENGVFKKKPGWACKSCQYRTACQVKNMQLPKVRED